MAMGVGGLQCQRQTAIVRRLRVPGLCWAQGVLSTVLVRVYVSDIYPGTLQWESHRRHMIDNPTQEARERTHASGPEVSDVT